MIEWQQICQPCVKSSRPSLSKDHFLLQMNIDRINLISHKEKGSFEYLEFIWT